MAANEACVYNDFSLSFSRAIDYVRQKRRKNKKGSEGRGTEVGCDDSAREVMRERLGLIVRAENKSASGGEDKAIQYFS